MFKVVGYMYCSSSKIQDPGEHFFAKFMINPLYVAPFNGVNIKQASKERKVCIDPFIGATKQGSKDRKNNA
jgi:hypothetical protein